MGRPLQRLRTITVLDPVEAGLREEDIAARTPILLVEPASPPTFAPSHSLKTEPLPSLAGVDRSVRMAGWTRLCLVLRSASARQVAGWWVTREDWHFLELGQTLMAAAGLAQSGYAVAVIETWVRCRQDQCAAGLSMTDTVWAPATRRTWLVADEDVPDASGVTEPGNTLAHLLRRARQGEPYGRADRRAWVTRALPD